MDRMIEYEKTYQEYKQELDGELQRTAEGFVRIGYLLKVARDTNILAESGYKTVTEFAAAEYNLDKTQVSRFISINDRFSEGGYSERLQEHYRGFGYAKLTIMLQLPEGLTEELTPAFSKAEIQALKDEEDEEKKVSDLEIMMEGTPAEADTDLDRTIDKLCMDDYKLYEDLWKLSTEDWSVETLQEVLAPSGLQVVSVRIPGIGRKELILKDAENGNEIVLRDLRSGEKETHTWEELQEAVVKIVDTEDYKAAWTKRYDKPWPEEKSSVAPVQPKAEKPKPIKKKDAKVTKAKTEKPKAEKPKPAAVVEEEQLPGQMSVEDYEGIVPDATYEEVRDGDSDADQEGEPCTGDIDGVSGGAGDPADDVECGQAERAEGSEIQSDHAGDGAPESGGSEEDPRTVEDIWMKIYANHSEIAKYLTVWESQHTLMERDMLQKLYDMTVAMAAGFERLLMEEKE